ncbi:monomethylamine:corrinoid methyltransferase [Pectinatus brassicae]|uniref:Methylamine--corrinoid protein Co-methyltransferase n=1 Tax=Pectinatus brassicae TaxID=862415 RepID=A0A840UGH4_9FIRM|nr:monomethylamine:corrinoid methyltransferase [Pectinatus brassicae]MBB5336851.1 methylamine--corrinoid protein Co-methyltransferase [Pectinatus brassicae]
MAVAAKPVTVFDVYDRAKTGPEVDEKQWDFKMIPRTASELKKKYDIKLDKNQIIPTDMGMMKRLFKAGMEMLVTCGIYCIDTKRVIKYTEQEVLDALAKAPKEFQFGEVGLHGRLVKCRKHTDACSPIIQGGPTGAPCSEEHFLAIHQSYAKEPIVDTIVDGVLQTIKGKDPTPGTPWEIEAVKSEAIMVRAAQDRAGRSGMGL